MTTYAVHYVRGRQLDDASPKALKGGLSLSQARRACDEIEAELQTRPIIRREADGVRVNRAGRPPR